MSWIVESPWPALMLGLVVEAVLAMMLFRTGRAIFIGLMVAAGLVVLGLVVVERMIVTPREEIEEALDTIAAALVANDPPRVLALFCDNSPRRGEVQSLLSHVTVRAVNIGGDLEVRLNDLTNPPQARAFFTGRVDARDNRGTIPYEHAIRKFQVTLRRENGQWRIYDYADADPRAK